MGLDLVLRTSLIWNGEVMEDRVLERPQPVTIGHTGTPMFVTPDLGLPAEFEIVKPGARGYLLVLAARMRGVVCLGGVQQEVAALVGVEPFHAVSLQVGDWGVVELDDTCKLFFQFVPREEHAVILTRQQLHIGAIGFGVFALLGAAIFAAKGLDLGESLFRAVGLTALIFGGAALARVVAKQNGESQASLAFSIILHTAILSFTFHVYSEDTAYAFPEPRQLTADYLVSRPADPKPVLAKITSNLPTLGAPASTTTTIEVQAAPPSGNQGGAGALRQAPPRRAAAPPSPFGVFDNPDLIALTKRDVRGDVGRLSGVTGTGMQRGEAGTPRVTRGDDPRGPAAVHQPTSDEVAPIPVRGAVCVGAGCSGGVPIEIATPPTGPMEGPHLTAKEVDDTVKRRAGIFRACYQRQVNKSAELAGSIVMRWKITAQGDVTNVKRQGGSLTSQELTDCLTLNIGLLKFPAKGGANVTYPFVFSLGS